MYQYQLAFLVIFSVSSVYASDIQHFADIPHGVTTTEAIAVVRSAASSRKWTVIKPENDTNKLRIKIEHRGYRAVLDLTFSRNMITYIDSTTYGNIDEDDESVEWVRKRVPRNWLINLKKDTKNYFVLNEINRNSSDLEAREITKRTLQADNLEEKLKGLKNLYNKGLITQEEYNLKKKDLLSGY